MTSFGSLWTSRKSWHVVPRVIGWVLLCAFLALEIDLALHDWLQYRAAPETFHRVFRDPYLEQAISRAFGLLAVLGLILQIRGWRGWRFSRIAISVPVLEATFVAANNVFGILVTCCG